jgi:hypothetical protein
MKHTILYILFFAVILAGCRKNEEIVFRETGIVKDFAGAGNCGFVIELDNDKQIQPLYYPDEFSFAQGQRVLVEYTELPDVIPTCDCGVAADISYIEELSCTPYIDLYSNNYDSLKTDPVYIKEAYINGNSLHLKISYGGGCRDHYIDLARIHEENSGSNDIPLLEIRHDANGDLCEAFITKVICFDVSPLIIEGINEFRLFANSEGEENFNEIFEF